MPQATSAGPIFGLGNSERAEISVKWPDGEFSHPYRVFANQFVIADREKPVASYWYPERPEDQKPK